MHRFSALRPAALAAALLLLPHSTSPARAATPGADDLQAGREALGRGDGPAAVSLLESALLTAPAAERPAVLDDLRRAYDRAASQADAAGDGRRARSYRENLLIIDRSRRPASPVGSATPPETIPDSGGDVPRAPAPLPAADASPARPPAASDATPPVPPTEGPIPPPPAPVPGPSGGTTPPSTPIADLPSPSDPAIAPARNDPPAGPEEPARPEGSSGPAASPSAAGPADDTPTADLIRAADASFRAQKYEEAGRIYAGLHRRGDLPESHRSVWAYCRFVAVARQINAQPTTPAEWSAIHAEIREVRALAPELWFSKYLQDLAAERAATVGAKPSAFIVRGQSAPDDPGEVPGGDGHPSGGSWQVMDTENFRIFHADPGLADRVARRAEQARAELLRYWSGSEPAAPWSPRCDVYVYPDAASFAERTGQPSDSPGFSTMGLSGGKVVARRINLRADHDGLVEAVVPHEVTHVVLADLFPSRQIPRWADEGMAVLAEPLDAQADRLSRLDAALTSGRVFRTGALMTATMPDGRYWDLYMAQSTSLARYLIQLDSPARLVAFLRESERLGAEPALRSVYGFEGFDDLHARWLAHARRGTAAPAIAARPDGEGTARE